MYNNKEKWSNISISFNDGASQSLLTVTTEEYARQLNEIANEIYYNPKTDEQDNLKWHCEHEGVKLYFIKLKENVEQSFIYVSL